MTSLELFVNPLIAACLLAFLHYCGKFFSEHIERFHTELLSLGAGLMISTFFVEILPHLSFGEMYLGHFVFIFFLIGFVSIHILEKFFYQRASNIEMLEKEKIEFEAAGLVAYGLIIGIVIVVLFETYGEVAYIVLVPFFVRSFTITATLGHVIDKIGSNFNQIIQIIAPIAGALLGLFLIQNKLIMYLIFSITMGLILYIVVRDMIPLGKEGKPIFFIIGIILTIGISLLIEI
jgi:zinc transporter ZupT